MGGHILFLYTIRPARLVSVQVETTAIFNIDNNISNSVGIGVRPCSGGFPGDIEYQPRAVAGEDVGITGIDIRSRGFIPDASSGPGGRMSASYLWHGIRRRPLV